MTISKWEVLSRGKYDVFLFLYVAISLQILLITKTCPCNIQGFFSAVKIKNFVGIFVIFFLFLLKT